MDKIKKQIEDIQRKLTRAQKQVEDMIKGIDDFLKESERKKPR